MNTRLAVLAGLVIVLWLGVEVYLAGFGDKGPPPAAPPVQFLGGHGLGQRQKGRSWTAKYDRITSNPDQTVLDLENVHDAVIYKEGKPYLKVRAARMTVNLLTKDFAASGKLHIETVSHSPYRSFETTAASWNEASQRLVLPNPCSIDTGAALPLTVDSGVVDVRHGDVELHKVAGAVRLK